MASAIRSLQRQIEPLELIEHRVEPDPIVPNSSRRAIGAGTESPAAVVHARRMASSGRASTGCTVKWVRHRDQGNRGHGKPERDRQGVFLRLKQALRPTVTATASRSRPGTGTATMKRPLLPDIAGILWTARGREFTISPRSSVDVLVTTRLAVVAASTTEMASISGSARPGRGACPARRADRAAFGVTHSASAADCAPIRAASTRSLIDFCLDRTGSPGRPRSRRPPRQISATRSDRRTLERHRRPDRHSVAFLQVRRRSSSGPRTWKHTRHSWRGELYGSDGARRST